MRETHTPITVFTLQLPEIYSKERREIQLKKGDELAKKKNARKKKVSYKKLFTRYNIFLMVSV